MRLMLALFSVFVMSGLAWSQAPAEQPVSTTGELDSANEPAELIEKLGADSFWDREAAMATLISAGPSVEEEVRDALDDEDAEIRYRAQKVLIEIDKSLVAGRRAAFLEGDVDQLKANVKSWKRLEAMVGNTPQSRQLFLNMLAGGEEVLTKCENNASECSALISQLYTAQSYARRTGKEVISPGGVTAMVFALSDQKLSMDTTATSRVSSLLYQYRSRLDEKNPAFKKMMGAMVQNAKGTQQYQMLRLAQQFNLNEDGVELARKMLGGGHNSYRAQAMLTIGKLGDEDDVAALAKYVKDGGTLGSTGRKGGKRRTTKLGDVALAMCIVLKGEKPKAFGFPDAPDGRPTSTSYHNYGFYEESKRSKAQQKWAELLAEK